MGADEDAPRSLWPLGLALALAAMITGSLSLLWIATTHPDAAVTAHPLAADGAPPRAAH
jgi:membrane protein implicated in regulation of membrane protease activity